MVNILLVDPNLPVTLKYRADCPHCGDHSFPVEITGRVYMGSVDSTVYDGHRNNTEDESPDIIYLVTSKGKAQ